jgi:hypothetical protein
MDANLAVGDALVERIRSDVLARLVDNYAASEATSWSDLVSRKVLSTHWNNVQNVCARSGFLVVLLRLTLFPRRFAAGVDPATASRVRVSCAHGTSVGQR